jgi:biotin synthase
MNKIQKAKEKALSGQVLTEKEIIELLSIELGSKEDEELRQAAREVAKIKTNNIAYIWSAIGADYIPCPMNCKFCSFGEEWGIIKDKVRYTTKEIIEKARYFIEKGARFIVLRTTEFYSIPKLIKIVKRMRKEIPGNYEVILNTGELDMTISNMMYEEGINGIYHACRIREGIDTPFEVDVRKNTMNNVKRSKLDLISLVEPIAPEHTNEEIAKNFLNIVSCEATISGAMARIPVKGTPLGDTEMISESRLAQIIAVLRLSGGNVVKDICVHPVSLEALNSGANVMVVETGAVPRDANLESNSWKDIDMNKAHELLEKASYTVKNTK